MALGTKYLSMTIYWLQAHIISIINQLQT